MTTFRNRLQAPAGVFIPDEDRVDVDVSAFVRRLILFDQYILDGIVDLIGQLPAYVGFLLRPAQNGLVQFYALLMALGVAGFVVAVLLR